MKILYSAAVLAVLSFGTTGLVQAETVSYAQAIRSLTAVCGADIDKYCKGVKPGGGAISSCLANNNVSSQCAATHVAAFALLARRAAAQDAAAEICKYDAERLCSNFKKGRARILGCLTRRDNVRKVSKKCNQAITDAGWR